MLAAILLATSTARSAPEFEADNPELAKLAEEIWPRLVECADRPAPKVQLVKISTAGANGWAVGSASRMGHKLWVDIDGWPTPFLLRHELAHAWAYNGEIAEALAGVLADCAAGA